MIKNRETNLLEGQDSNISAQEIKKWSDDISQAKGLADKNLRKAFKEKFGVNFSKKLMNEILEKENPPMTSPEPAPEKKQYKTVEAEVKHAVIDLEALVDAQEAVEDQEAKGLNNPELNQETAKIDATRDNITQEAKADLQAVAEDNLENLGEKEKEEYEKIDQEVNALMVQFSSKVAQLNKPAIKPEKANKIQEELADIESTMEALIHKKNEIKNPSEKTVETKDAEPLKEENPKPEPALSPEPTPESEPAPAPEPAPEPTPEPIVEKQKDEVLEKFREFNIDEEELKNLPVFSSLSKGQQALVYEGLKQLSIVKIKDEAKRDVKAEISQKKWFGRIIGGLTKKYNIAKKEKENLANVKYGGLAENQASLDDLSNMIATMDIDARLENGKIKINYLQDRPALSPEQNKELERFNEVASEFSELPKDWAFDTANKKQQESYHSLEAKYLAAKKGALDILALDFYSGNGLTEINRADYQVKMMQLLMANPEVDKEFSKIEKQSAFRKMISGEAAARGSYMVGGFVSRHSMSMMIGLGGLPMAAASFVAIPLAAAGIGAWRSRDRAKANLLENDITGRKNDSGKKETSIEQDRKEAVQRLKDLVPAEYALDPNSWYMAETTTQEQRDEYDSVQEWYQSIMERYEKTNEKESDKTAKNFYQSEDLIKKIVLANQKVNTLSGEKYYNAVYSLKVRIKFTEDKLNAGLINFGSDAGFNSKLELIQALSCARTTLIYNQGSLETKEEQIREEDALAPEQKANSSLYSRDLEKRFASLIESKYFEFDKNLSEERKKYLVREMLKGAALGTAFAIGGMLLRDLAGELGIFSNHHDSVASTNKISPTQENSNLNSEGAAQDNTTETTPAKKIDNDSKGEVIGTEDREAVSGNNSSGQENFSDRISNDGLNGRSDSVWRSTREIFKNNAENLGYKGNINNAEELNKWAETQTANAIHNSGDVPNKVFEGNNVLLEQDADGKYSVRVEEGEGAKPGMLEQAKAVVEETAPKAISKVEPLYEQEAAQTEDPEKILSSEEETAIKNKELVEEIASRHGLKADRFTYGGTTENGGEILRTTVGSHEYLVDTQNCKVYLGNLNSANLDVILGDSASILEGGDFWSSIDFIESHVNSCEKWATEHGFSLKAEDIGATEFKTNLANHDILVNWNEKTFSYEWNGDNHKFNLPEGPNTKNFVENFLLNRSELENKAIELQSELNNGNIKGFAKLGRMLKELNGGEKLADHELASWIELYKNNFSKEAIVTKSEIKKEALRKIVNWFLDRESAN